MVRLRLARLVSAFALLALVAGACFVGSPIDDADPDGTLTTYASPPPRTIDPQKANGVDQAAQIGMVFESLLAFDPKTLLPVPAAARELPTVSSDGLTYRFTIGDHAKYSDGTPVRAADFAYGFIRLCDPVLDGGGPAAYASLAYVIVGCAEWNSLDPEKDPIEKQNAARQRLTTQGIQVQGDREIAFTLREPARYFPSIVALWIGSPVREADVVRGGDRWAEDPKTYIGNGPFVLSSWDRNDRMVFVPNRYYRKPPRINTWTKLHGEPTTDAGFELYKRGEVDVLTLVQNLSPENRKLLDADEELRSQLLERSGSCTQVLGLNSRRPPFDDPTVRLAFAKALDRGSYLEKLEGGLGTPALSFIPPGLPGHDADDTTLAFEPAEARRLLASSRYAGSEALDMVTMPSNGQFPYGVARATWAKEQWKENLGIDLIAVPVENGAALSQLFRRLETVPHVFPKGWCADYPDQQNWLSFIFHSKSTLTWIRDIGFSDPEFDRLTAEADREADQARRDDLYRQASRILTSHAVFIPMIHEGLLELRKPWVKGIVDTAFDWELSSIARFEGLYIAKKK